MFVQYAHHGFNIGQMIVNSVVHGLVYGVIFKVFHALSLPVAVGVGLVGLLLLYLFFRKK
jgi:hypothetical protein